MNKCYIASGWFSPEWLEELETIKSTLDNLGLAYFSPKGIKDLKESFSKMNKMGTSEGLLIDILNFFLYF